MKKKKTFLAELSGGDVPSPPLASPLTIPYSYRMPTSVLVPGTLYSYINNRMSDVRMEISINQSKSTELLELYMIQVYVIYTSTLPHAHTPW